MDKTQCLLSWDMVGEAYIKNRCNSWVLRDVEESTR